MNTPVETQVGGMTCGNCALSITQYLAKQGITDAVANSVTGQLTFSIDDPKRVAELYAGIEKLGYTVNDEQYAAQKASASKSVIPEIRLSLKQKVAISVAFWIPLMAHMFISWSPLHNPWVQLVLSLPVFLLGVSHFGRSAMRSIRNGIPNMDVLIFIGSAAAFIYSISGWILYPEDVHRYLFFETSASIITLIFLGNLLEAYTMQQTGAGMKALMQYREVEARIVFTDSIGKETIQSISNKFLKVNDVVQVNTGDRIPADGVLLSGHASVDESMMSGESLPVSKSVGDTLVGGTLVSDGAIRLRVSAVGDETALSRIIQLVNEAQAAKSPLQRLADKIAAIFVPVVVAIALLTFFVSYFGLSVTMQDSMMRAVAVLVVACPCAMGLATPAAVMVGMGRAAKMGILMKGGDTLQRCRDINTIVFDKTGTLSTGDIQVARFESTMPEAMFKAVVSSLEAHSSHPIAKALVKSWPAQIPLQWDSVREEKGKGLVGVSQEGITWRIGSRRFTQTLQNQEHDIYVYRNDEFVGWIDLQDTLREGLDVLIPTLQAKGFQTIMLSGDRKAKCDAVAQTLGIHDVYSECLPEAKLAVLHQLMQTRVVAMVGDGINDAPALTAAHVGISMSDATQIAMQHADVVLINNDLNTLPTALAIGKHTFLTIQQNLFWAFFYNVLAIPFAAAGYLTPGWAAAIMGMSDIVLIANSMRLRYKKLM